MSQERIKKNSEKRTREHKQERKSKRRRRDEGEENKKKEVRTVSSDARGEQWHTHSFTDTHTGKAIPFSINLPALFLPRYV